MLDAIQVIGTGLILLFTGLTFWYQFIRTPRSDVGLEFIARDEPYSTNSGNISFHGPTVQIYNKGDMDAVLEEKNFSWNLRNSSGEPFEPPENGSFGISSRNQGETVVPAGGNVQLKPKISVRGLVDYPEDFNIKIRFNGSIRDNVGTEEIDTFTEFQFVNERVRS